MANEVKNPTSRSGEELKDIGYPQVFPEQWCNIRIFKYEYRAEANASKQITKTLGNIRLPLPMQLQTGYQQQWNDTDYITAALAQAATSDASIMDQLKNAGTNPTVIAGLVAATGRFVGGTDGIAAAAGGIAGAVASASFAVKGVTTNKFESVTYEKPNLRMHSFSWNMVAKNAKEGRSIQDIILKLKYHSSPDGGGGVLYRYPELFKIDFTPRNLFTIGPSVLEGMNVDYHAAGRPLYHATEEMPISVTVSCTFKETAAITKESIQKGHR